LIPAYMHGRHQKGFITLAGETYRGKQNKSEHANENQNPLENACIEWKTKPVATLERK
jgi:hypothetical protein